MHVARGGDNNIIGMETFVIQFILPDLLLDPINIYLLFDPVTQEQDGGQEEVSWGMLGD